MSRYIDAEWLKEHIEVISYEGMWHTMETDEFVAVDNINQAPSIDIVRCKECKCGKPYSDKQLECDALGLGGLKFPDDFCSRGEREGE